MIWLLTCEHYSNGVPLEYANYFIDAVDVLESHRGYDVRAAPVFIRLEPLFDEGFFYRYTRLLIEPNRSLNHRHLFSPFTTALPNERKTALIRDLYQPYRKKVSDFISDYIEQGVFHIALHTFTPVLGNQNRETPIGISFDPNRKAERDLALLMKKCLNDVQSELKIRFNYPYKGRSDSFTGYLRKSFPENYLGYELEVRNDVALELRPALYEGLANLRGILE